MNEKFIWRKQEYINPFGEVIRTEKEKVHYISTRRSFIENQKICNTCHKSIGSDDLIYIGPYEKIFCSFDCLSEFINEKM